MIELWIAGIGVRGPGFADWDAFSAIVRGEADYMAAPITLDAPAMLSARERRRTSTTVRLALGVAEEGMRRSSAPGEDLAAVFGSANSDGATVHQLLGTLATHDGLVSPTQFHNSVHNAATGYWSIGTGSKLPATSIAAHDFTFGATLLKTALQASTERTAVLMVAFDMPFPEPLHSSRPLSDSFALSFVIFPERTENSFARLDVDWKAGMAAPITEPRTTALRTLWQGNPAARSIPLLEAIATGAAETVTVRYPADGSLTLGVASW